jgi:hypothetical protein
LHFAGDVLVFAPDLPDRGALPVDHELRVRVIVRGVEGAPSSTHEWTTVLVNGPFSPTERFLIQASRDFTGSGPSQSALSSMNATALSSGRRAALTTLATSDAWLGSVVDGFYRSILGRAPDAEGRRHWIEQFRSGGMTTTAMASSFYASEEYFRRSGGSVSAWVDTLYREILGRASDPGGHAGWVSETERVGRHAVAVGFYQSPESRFRRVGVLYTTFLRRSPDETGLRTWSEEILRTGNDVVLALELASSDEYFIRTSG